MEAIERVVLIGFSGVGKSTVGRSLARLLGWTVVDTDEELEVAFEMTIPDVFRRHGEATFRRRERATLAAALTREGVVVACGGGAVVEPNAWANDLLGRSGTLVVALDARPETSLSRLENQQAAEGQAAERPLLAADDPLARIQSLKQQRQHAYDAAHISLIVDNLSPDAIAAEIASMVRAPTTGDEPVLRLDAPSGTSTVYIASGLGRRIGKLIRSHWPSARRCWIVSDENVARLHGSAITASATDEGLSVDVHAVPAGEGSKSLAEASRLYDWLLDGGIERGDVIVALGGGVVGDLAGFVAATTLRGVGLVQVPTSLLAMVDSSVGGKTGINHRTGKNLIGAFYQPPLVAIDPTLLQTLPERELTAGWAEVVKHAVIQPSTPGGQRGDLLAFMVRNERSLRTLHEPATSYLIRRNVGLKAAVVEADEREAGIRAYLNFGHTLGHAIEAAGYSLLHGEAIAVGMRAVARMGVAMGTCTELEAADIAEALDRFRLPLAAAVDPDRVLTLIGSDKKRAAGRLRWVLPVSGGGVAIRDDVPPAVATEALWLVTASPTSI